MNKLKKISFENEEQSFELTDTPSVENISSVQYCASDYREEMCFFYCMWHVGNELKMGESSWSTYEDYYRREYGQTSTRDGVAEAEAIEFFNQNFTTYGCKSGYTDENTVQEALEAGAQVIGFMNQGCGDKSHALIIKSYNPVARTYYTYDPQADELGYPREVVYKDISVDLIKKAIGAK